MIRNVQILGALNDHRQLVLSDRALLFLEELHLRFEDRRQALLARRLEISEGLRLGYPPAQLEETRWIRLSDWKVPPPPFDLTDRRVEITGPTDAKMMINALNSGAKVFMADLEDSLSPTWENVIDGQINLHKAVNRTLEFHSADKYYRLNRQTATLVVRPRGWHLHEAHLLINGTPMSASLFDFGLYFFHNARILADRGSGPLFYLPKLENHLEARLWNDVFIFAQESLGLACGTIRATVLIETCLAAFEMEEILFELREHAAGLNAGRWDYLFSMIKKLGHNPDLIFPDRSELNMTVPFMRAYTQTIVDVCHRRGAHAIGGMAAFIPSRRDKEVNDRAIAKVREDKLREARDGFDGTWVAHPDLVPVAMAVFDEVLGGKPDQKHVEPSFRPQPATLLPTGFLGSRVTSAGVADNISVALQYIRAWLEGSGAVGINNLMEDAATAEIARAQLWQWVRRNVQTAEGDWINRTTFQQRLNQAFYELGGNTQGRLQEARDLLQELVLSEDFIEFLTLPAYQLLTQEREPTCPQQTSRATGKPTLGGSELRDLTPPPMFSR